MEGTGVTSTGVNLQSGKQKYVVAVDPHVIPYGTKLKIPHNPFGNPNIVFTASDTGGAIQGNRIDFFVASGRKQQNGWGRRSVQYQVVGRGSPKDVMVAGQEGRGASPQQPGVNTQTTKTVTPGVDNSAQRKSLMFQYLSAPKADPFSVKNLQPANVSDPVKAVSQLQSQGPDLSKTLAKAAGGTNSLLSLAGGLQAAQDVPAVTKTVVQRQQAAQGGGGGGGGYRHPIPGASISSHDNGADFETHPGTPLRAVGSGTITTLKGAFTTSGSIVLKLDHPYHGQRYVYYGHLQDQNKEVRPGQRVGAGQILARSSRRPDGAENMPGHVEIGFALGSNGGIETGGPYQGDRSRGSNLGQLFSRFLSGLR